MKQISIRIGFRLYSRSHLGEPHQIDFLKLDCLSFVHWFSFSALFLFLYPFNVLLNCSLSDQRLSSDLHLANLSYVFFYKRTGHFHNFYWTQVMLLQLLELMHTLFKKLFPNVLEHCVLLFVFDENPNVGIRHKFGMMSNIHVHKIHLPGQ